jgi:uncharacterized protein (TIGR02600 family)
VIVLGMLVLVVVLVIAFFSSISTELQSSKSYASGTDVRTLADSAVNIVISQIQDATAASGTSTSSSGGVYSLAWASQPGMIRTYDNSGNLVTAYKLYSSNQLRVSGSAFNPGADLANAIAANWSATSNANTYTDLNSPVAVGSGTAAVLHYPIIDPNAVAPSQSGSGTLVSGTSTPIQGCFINNSGTYSNLIATGTQTDAVPMPVQWLYVLKSGSIAPMVSGTVAGAGALLPNNTRDTIVGRIAFWTDDETCKVNVNTASEGTFWARPWISYGTSAYELSLAKNMPAQNEFQRYPGHPAMTCLSSIFSSIGGGGLSNDLIYNITPRLTGGGSEGGTMPVTQGTVPLIPNTNHLYASVDEFLFSGTNVAVTSGTSTRQPNPTNAGSFSQTDIEKARFFLTATSRAPEVNLFNKPRVALWPLQANTANPDDPIDSPNRNAIDKLIAFCSTAGSGTNAVPYYFQRYNVYTTGTNQSPRMSSQGPSDDWNNIPRNQSLYAYLQTLTGSQIPGLGGDLYDKYVNPIDGVSSRDQILTEMMDFIRSNVNTFSTAGNPSYFYTPFNPKGFATGQSQILPLVVPQGSAPSPGRPNATQGFGRFSTVIQAALVFYAKDQLTVSGTVPAGGSIVMNGGTTTYTTATVLNNYPIPNGASNMVLTGTNYSLSADASTARNIGVVLLLQPFCPSPGPPPWTPNVRYAVSGLNAFTATPNILGATGTNMGFPSTMVNLVSGIDDSINETAQANLEILLQWPNPAAGSARAPKTLGATNPDSPDPQYYPFFSSFAITGTAQSFLFNGGPIQIKIYNGIPEPLDPKDLVQTINMNFPALNTNPLQVPRVGAMTKAAGKTTVTMVSSNYLVLEDYNNRLTWYANVNGPSGNPNGDYRWGIASDGSNGHQLLPLIVSSGTLGDVVRGVEPRYVSPAKQAGAGGDYRLIAGSANVPADYFEGHGATDVAQSGALYLSGTSTLVHNLHMTPVGSTDTSNSNYFYPGAGAKTDLPGRLLYAANYIYSYNGDSARNGDMPVAPRGLGADAGHPGAVMSTGTILGDWDNGIGGQPDGPYINKADEGNANISMGSTGIYYATGGYVTGAGIVDNGASFSPNRQISSAVAFGSLSSGIDVSNPDNSLPWQTLLFCKNPLSGPGHPGFGVQASGTNVAPPYKTPPDNAFLDLFSMPIVEPYAISDPFSTAGKVNMNYQIEPFTYLTRDTAMRAVLKSTDVMAIPANIGNAYKSNTTGKIFDCRYTIDSDEQVGTLQGFEQRFSSGDIFRSASEICDIYLVPGPGVSTATSSALPLNPTPTYNTMASWWQGSSQASPTGYKLTGDNVREEPYGQIYPRLTTKSNSYTVHVQVQSLKKASNTPLNQFVPGQDQVTGELRGSYVIQRYLDPNASSLVSLTGNPSPKETDPDAMLGPYKFRIISSKRFAP